MEAINNQMELLLGVLDNTKGFWSVVSGWEGEDDIHEHQKCMIHIICQHLRIVSCQSNDAKSSELG